MRKQVIAAIVAVVSLSALGIAAAPDQANSIAKKLTGTWIAEPFEIPLNSAFDISVWGQKASSVRKVEMTIRPTGEGTIRVTRSIADGGGKTKPGSVSVEAAQLMIRAPKTTGTDRAEPVVEVLNPERRYPDDPADRWPLDGLSVKLITADLDSNKLHVRFDLPDGRGSFVETLVRRSARVSNNTASR